MSSLDQKLIYSFMTVSIFTFNDQNSIMKNSNLKICLLWKIILAAYIF